MAAYERICSSIKADFLPFVPHILPDILAKFTLAPQEWGNSDSNNICADEREAQLTFKQGPDGQIKVLVMHSSDIDDLSNALDCIHTIVEELGEKYAPYVAQTAHSLLPVFDFNMQEGIRDMAFETWGQLCDVARKSGSPQVTTELVNKFMDLTLPQLDLSNSEVLDFDALKTRADGITTCLKKAGEGVLQPPQLKHICQTVLKGLDVSFTLRDKSAQTKAIAKAEGEDDDADSDEEVDGMSVRTALCEIWGALMQHHPDIFVAEGLTDSLAVVQKLLSPAATNQEDRKLALFIVCDFLEHLGSRVTPHWQLFIPQLSQDILNNSAEIRQPACYGMSIAAKEQAFSPLAVEIAGKLAGIVTETRKRSKKKSEKVNQAVADNALSALLEILLHHEAVLNTANATSQIWQVWLEGLPCQEDEQEGVKNHKHLLQLIAQEKKEVVGEGGKNLPQLIKILVDVYQTDFADQETSAAIGQLALRLGSKLENVAPNLSEKQRKRLQRIVKEAQDGTCLKK